jgi:hypothetical protein
MEVAKTFLARLPISLGAWSYTSDAVYAIVAQSLNIWRHEIFAREQ